MINFIKKLLIIKPIQSNINKSIYLLDNLKSNKNNKHQLQMPTTPLSQRKLHHQQQLLHVNLVAIPYFHSTQPTNTLIMKKVDLNLLDKYNCNLTSKLYYKNNRPIVSRVVSFQSVEEAQGCREAIIRHYNNQLNNSTDQKLTTTNTSIIIQFAKPVTHLPTTLYFSHAHYCIHPQTRQLKHLIDTTSQLVVMDGYEIQQKLKSMNQPMLQFLNESILSLEHQYYRWRVYSYMQGDGEGRYRGEGFRMVENGWQWYPPLTTTTTVHGTTSSSSSSSVIPYPCVLNFKQIKYFTQTLQKMQRKKYAIEELMIFAIHNINSAVHITAILMVRLYQVLMMVRNQHTTTGDIVSILYLISDILFNSTNHIYRDLFQSQLPKIVYHYVLLRQQQHQLPPLPVDVKMLTEMKRLFNLWEKKFVFDENFMKGLEFLLELVDVKRLYRLTSYTQHKRLMEIKGGDNPQYELEKCCKENGLPYFEGKQEQSKVFLNALFWENDKLIDVEPNLGKYDGDQITDKQMQKIQSKGIRVVSCQNLPLSMLYDKNWKSSISKTSLSQDGQ